MNKLFYLHRPVVHDGLLSDECKLLIVVFIRRQQLAFNRIVADRLECPHRLSWKRERKEGTSTYVGKDDE